MQLNNMMAIAESGAHWWIAVVFFHLVVAKNHLFARKTLYEAWRANVIVKRTGSTAVQHTPIFGSRNL